MSLGVSPSPFMTPSANASVINKAIGLHQSGSLKMADKLYAKILKNKPNHTEALHMRGVLKFQQDEYQQAEYLLKKSIQSASTALDPWIHFHLAEVLAATDRHKSAVSHFKKAIENGANDADAHYMLGNSFFELQRYSDAIVSYEFALELKPNDSDCRLNLANAFEASGELSRAIECLESLLVSNADSVGLKLQLSELLTNNHQALKAHTVVLQIDKAELVDIDRILGTARYMHRKVRYASSRHLLDLVLPYVDDLDQQQFDLTAGLLNDAGRYVEARELLQSLSEDSGRSAWSWFQQGLCAQVAGDFESAGTCHQTALKSDASLGAAAYSLASNGAVAVSDELLREWTVRKDDASIPESSRAQFAFAVARVHDSQNDIEQAFEAYLQANAIIAKSQPFDADNWDKYTDSIIDTFSAEYLAKQYEQMQLGSLTSDLAGDHLHFIVGMPRSGSTLLEQTLKSKFGFIGLGEHYALRSIVADIPEVTGFLHSAPQSALDLEASHIAQFRKQYLNTLISEPIKNALGSQQKNSSESKYVDKMLGNFVRLGVLALMFPNARILHCCRDPMATGVSCFTNAFGSGLKFTYDLYAMGRAWQSYQRLMKHWHDVLPLKMMDVGYEDLVSDPDGYQHVISKFLEVSSIEGRNTKSAADFVSASSNDPISTASFWQARQPISTSSMEAWKRFDFHLDPLRKGLEYQRD